jgi:hypothetical protein
MNAFQQIKNVTNQFTILIENKGEFFVSRKSVNHPFVMGLRFKGLNEDDFNLLDDVKSFLGYSFSKRHQSGRCISNYLVHDLIKNDKKLQDVFKKSSEKYPVLNDVIVSVTNKILEKESKVKVLEDLPF